MPWASNAMDVFHLPSVSFRGKRVIYIPIVSLMCPFCVLEHVSILLDAERLIKLTEHNKITAEHSWQNCGKLGLDPVLNML